MTQITGDTDGKLEAAKRETFFNKKNLISFGLGGLAVLAAQQAGAIATGVFAGLGLFYGALSGRAEHETHTRIDNLIGYVALSGFGALMVGCALVLAIDNCVLARNQSIISASLESEVLMKIAQQEITNVDSDQTVEFSKTYKARNFTAWSYKPEEREMHISARVLGRQGNVREIETAGKNTRSVKLGLRSFVLADDGKRKKLVETTGQGSYAAIRSAAALAPK